jgi:hypothetical protein
MLPRALLTLLTLCLCSISLRASDEDTKTLRVFLFMGQSNMVGSDSRVADIQLYPPFAGLEKPQGAVRYSYCIGREDKTKSEGWTELEPLEGFFGPELSFARSVTQVIKAPIAIIKVAAGGTTLGGDWNPDQPSGFKLYPLALEWVRSALKELDRQAVPWRLEGFMWHQGENDMFEEAYRKSYAANLARFMACWRRDLATPSLRFFIGELCTKTVWGMDNRAPMNAIALAQRAVAAADPLAAYVPTSHIGVEIGGDGGLHYHYGTLGQLEHGVNYAQDYLRAIGRGQPHEPPLEPWPYAKDELVRLYVLAGHRNMEGECAFVQELKALPGKAALAQDNPRIAFRYCHGGGYKLSNGWEPLRPAGCYDTFGPELSFADSLARQSKERIAIAKFTHSGSQIVDWTPKGSETPARNLYPEFQKFVQSSVEQLQARGQRVELAGIVYHLGENDMSFGPYRRQAIEFLAQLIAQSRKDLALPELTWFVSQQPPSDSDKPGAHDVTAQLRALAAADPHLVHLPLFDLPGRERELVITTPGIVALGERLAAGVSERKRAETRSDGPAHKQR